jgi:hypothetical protein
MFFWPMQALVEDGVPVANHAGKDENSEVKLHLTPWKT